MASEPISLRGVILTSREFKDKDRIISFLSSTAGVIDICVKGTGKQGSKLQSATIPFVVCDVVISMTGSFYYLKEVSLVYSNSEIYQNLEALVCANHIGSLLSSSYIEQTNSREFYELCVYTYYKLSEKPSDFKIIYSAFNWRFLNILGLNIQYDLCSGCSSKLDSYTYLSLTTGESYCNPCFQKKAYNEYLFPMSGAAIKALNSFLTADLKKLFSVNLDNESLDQLVDFTTKYIDSQLEGTYDELIDLLKKIGS